jgi:hypothetical protein
MGWVVSLVPFYYACARVPKKAHAYEAGLRGGGPGPMNMLTGW